MPHQCQCAVQGRLGAIHKSLKKVSPTSSLSVFVILAFLMYFSSCEKSKDVDVKDIAEEWFTQQAVGSLGKKFLEKVKCPKFVSHFQEKYPELYGKSAKYSKDQVSSVVRDISLLITQSVLK